MNQELDYLLHGRPKEFEFHSPLQAVTARMLQIERENMTYNEATNFGEFPNGQEAHIEAILAEWDVLKAQRQQLKYANR